MAKQFVTETLSVMHCPNCDVLFGITESFEERRRADHKSFYCPAGHSLSYGHETEAERLGRELKAKNDELARTRAQHDQTRARVRELADEVRQKDRRINGYKGAIERTKRRVSNGRCPCCSHRFKNLEAHMKTHHPGWNPERMAEVVGEKGA